MPRIIKVERVPGGISATVELVPAVMGTRPRKVALAEPDPVTGATFQFVPGQTDPFPLTPAVVKDYLISAESDDEALVALRAAVRRDVGARARVNALEGRDPETLGAAAEGRIAAAKAAAEAAAAVVEGAPV